LYLHITAAASIGWLVWGHFPDALTWLGIGIISASGVINALAEWRRTKVPKTPNVI
jgi:drug/metabolite transporter (DMT)-like permease